MKTATVPSALMPAAPALPSPGSPLSPLARLISRRVPFSQRNTSGSSPSASPTPSRASLVKTIRGAVSEAEIAAPDEVPWPGPSKLRETSVSAPVCVSRRKMLL